MTDVPLATVVMLNLNAFETTGEALKAIAQIEKLILYQPWLIEFCNDFVVNLSKLAHYNYRAEQY